MTTAVVLGALIAACVAVSMLARCLERRFAGRSAPGAHVSGPETDDPGGGPGAQAGPD